MTPKGESDNNFRKASPSPREETGDPALEPDMVGMRIRVFREARDWTQSDLAKYLRVKREQVSKWERGNHYPKRQEISRLFFEDGLDFNYTYGGVLRTLPFELRESLLSKIKSDFSDLPHILHSSEKHLLK